MSRHDDRSNDRPGFGEERTITVQRLGLACDHRAARRAGVSSPAPIELDIDDETDAAIGNINTNRSAAVLCK